MKKYVFYVISAALSLFVTFILPNGYIKDVQPGSFAEMFFVVSSVVFLIAAIGLFIDEQTKKY